MRNLFLLLVIIVLSINIQAQRKLSSERKQSYTWFDLGFKGGLGNAVLLNKNILKDENIRVDYLSPSFIYGFKFGFTMTEVTSLNAEIYIFGFEENYDIEKAGPKQNVKYIKNINFDGFEYAFLFRLTAYSGFYAEIGPKFSKFKSIKVNNSIKTSFKDLSLNNYKESYTSLMAGIGMAVVKSPNDRLRINVGLRFNYCIDDIMLDVNKSPVEDGVYEWNWDYPSKYNNTEKTSPVSLQFMLEGIYYFGYYGKTKSGRYKLVLF